MATLKILVLPLLCGILSTSMAILIYTMKCPKQSLKRYMASGSHCPIGSHKLLVVVMGQRPR